MISPDFHPVMREIHQSPLILSIPDSQIVLNELEKAFLAASALSSSVKFVAASSPNVDQMLPLRDDVGSRATMEGFL